MSLGTWHKGNRVELLESGEAYFPRVFDAIRNARREVLIETYILLEDKTGQELQAVVLDAAIRGVRVELTVDGFGSADLSQEFIAAMIAAGVSFHAFDPQPRFIGMRTNLFYRLHRKLVVVDGRVAFLGGINFSHDHTREFGPEAKLDYSVQVEGPVVSDIERCMRRIAHRLRGLARRLWPGRSQAESPGQAAVTGDADAALVIRDNNWHRDDIERHYRRAIRGAQRKIIIANAYFFPGYRLLYALRRAAKRGVTVHLLLQGKGDVALAQWASSTLYEYLLRSGIRIHEYRERQMHGKVAVIDDDWATVGSSNLDPVSLLLNLEANIVVRNRKFATHLRARLMDLIEHGSVEITREQLPAATGARQAFNFLGLTLMRQLPTLARWLPAPRTATEPGA
ncbi:MAG: cardiolipin synthase ClsB [Nevskiales bacterium]